MILLRAVRCHRLRNLHSIINPTKNPISITPFQSSHNSSISRRPFSIPALSEPEESLGPENPKKLGPKKKSLNVYFKEAVGLLEKSETTEIENSDGKNAELKRRLKDLEAELRSLYEKRKEIINAKKERNNSEKKAAGEKENGGSEKETEAGISLAGLFGKMLDKKAAKSTVLKTEDPRVYKKLSPDMEEFVKCLYEKGYFKGSNFLPKKGLDLTCFENSYARDFVKHAALRFGGDYQEIAKWLSGSDLKKVALFGCPSLSKGSVFAAKSLRSFFSIQESNVCAKCSLKASCKLVKKSAPKSDSNNLDLAGVMRLITVYALGTVHPQLVVPEEIKASVSCLLKEVIRLSETVPS